MLSFWLVDDGSLDTVIECVCENCGRSWDVRFSTECASDYRDDSGALDEDTFIADMLADKYCEDCEDDNA